MNAPPSPSSTALCIAIVGAESTGKTTLARTLAHALRQMLAEPAAGDGPTPRVAWVPEWLRQWCDAHDRTPRADEQAAIATEQHARIGAAAATHDIVVCDTTALMTAVYSRLLFADRSLEALAVALHRTIDVTLLTALDLPWVADGHQRDGPHVREPVDDALRELLHGHGLSYAVVAGRGAQRQAQAVAAVKAVTASIGSRATTAPSSSPTATIDTAAPGPRRITTPLFTRLLGPAGTPPVQGRAAARWVCDCCLPEAEQALRRRA